MPSGLSVRLSDCTMQVPSGLLASFHVQFTAHTTASTFQFQSTRNSSANRSLKQRSGPLPGLYTAQNLGNCLISKLKRRKKTQKGTLPIYMTHRVSSSGWRPDSIYTNSTHTPTCGNAGPVTRQIPTATPGHPHHGIAIGLINTPTQAATHLKRYTVRSTPRSHGTAASRSAHPVACEASTPMSPATFTKLATAWSTSSGVCTALIWTRMRALPCGTTG